MSGYIMTVMRHVLSGCVMMVMMVMMVMRHDKYGLHVFNCYGPIDIRTFTHKFLVIHLYLCLSQANRHQPVDTCCVVCLL